MSGPIEIWAQAADCFSANIAKISDDQWEQGTNCGEWTVRELVDHATFWQATVGSMVGAGTTPGQDDWSSVQPALAAALADPSNLEGTIEGGPMDGWPKHQALGIATADVLLHAWDVARSTGNDETLPPAAVEAVDMGLHRLPPEMMRSPNMFGAEIEVADDASAQDKMLGFAGRQP